jgi:Uma2 family endonuclease
MNAPTRLRMTADEFILWAMEQPEGKRYELVGGEVFPMSPERVGHNEVKTAVLVSLRSAFRERGLVGQVFGDGMAVRVDETTIYEPDALVRLGDRLPRDAVEIKDPVIVVEVLSPSTQSVDTGIKLTDYFRLPSMRHYLVVNASSGTVTHYTRGT